MGLGFPGDLPLAWSPCSWHGLVPAHVNKATEPVDNLGGILSVVLVAALVLGINSPPVPNNGTMVVGSPRSHSPPGSRSSSGNAGPRTPVRPRTSLHDGPSGWRPRRNHRVRHADGRDVHRSAVPAERPGLFDCRSRAAILPAAALMVLIAPRSAKLVETRGARFTLLVGYVCCLPDSSRCWCSGMRQSVLGGRARLCVCRRRRRFRRNPGVAFAHQLGTGAPGRHGVGTADLQRDLGGAIMQSILGALLTAGYASAVAAAIAAPTRTRRRSPQPPVPAHEVVRRRRSGRRAVPEVLRARSPLGRSRLSSTGTIGRTPPGWWRS